MRKLYSELLYNEMKSNTNIIALTADLGFGILDNIRNDFSDRFYNVGAAEQFNRYIPNLFDKIMLIMKR